MVQETIVFARKLEVRGQKRKKDLVVVETESIVVKILI